MTPTPRNKTGNQQSAISSQPHNGVAVIDAHDDDQLPLEPAAESEAATPAPAQAEAVPAQPVRRSKKEADERIRLSFWEHVDAITPTEWEHTAIYVYRQDPPVEAVDGNYKYVARYTYKIDIEQLRKDHGGGKLKLNLSRTNSKPGERPELRPAHYVQIEGPPIIPKTHRMVNGKPEPETPAATQQPQSDAVDLARTVMSGQNEVLRASMATITDAARAGLEIVKDQVAAAAPPAHPQESSFDQAVKLLEVLRAEKPQADPLELAIKLMEIMDKRRGPERPPESIFDNIGKMADAIEKLKGLGLFPALSGGGGGAVVEAPSTATKLMETLAPIAMPIVNGIGQIVNGILNHQRNMKLMDIQMAQQQTAAQNGGAPPPNAGPVIQGTPVPGLPAGFTSFDATPAQQPATQAPVAAASTPQPLPTGEPASPEGFPAIDDNVLAGRIRDCWERGDDGYITAVVLKRLYPDSVEPFKQLVANRTMVDMFCAQHPLLAPVAGNPDPDVKEDWAAFVDDFIKEILRDENKPPEDTGGNAA